MSETLLKKYSAIAQSIAQEKGPFKLFALFELEDYLPWEWDIVLSAEWLPGNKVESLRFIFDKIRVVLNQEEFIKISKVVLLDINEPFVKELQKFLEAHHNPKFFSHVDIQGVEIDKGYVITSPLIPSEESSEILTQALQWVRQAAERGDSEAQNTLGLMYLKGEGVKKDLSLAEKWFRQAAALGYAPAQDKLKVLSH
ncbi:MAG: tetratricopeptide repeat protein [Pseudomonadota bacterium]